MTPPSSSVTPECLLLYAETKTGTLTLRPNLYGDKTSQFAIMSRQGGNSASRPDTWFKDVHFWTLPLSVLLSRLLFSSFVLSFTHSISPSLFTWFCQPIFPYYFCSFSSTFILLSIFSYFTFLYFCVFIYFHFKTTDSQTDRQIDRSSSVGSISSLHH